MECPNCGKTIGIEELICPACGCTNPLAEQHNENIKQYDKRFRKTQDSVIKSARKTEGVGIRAGIFAILVVVIIALAIVWGMVSAAGEGETSEDRRTDALRNKKEYHAQMEEYLEEGDYITFAAFIKAHNIPFNTEPYTDYSRLQYVADAYYSCVQYWEKVLFRSDDPDYWDSSEMDISHLCSHLDGFAETYECNRENEKKEDLASYMDDMNADIHAMLRRYLHMTDSEADEFLAYPEIKKAVIMEEILLGEDSENE